MLCYGRLYGPGTGFDAAARAAGLAVVRGTTGIYNIAEDDGTLACDKRNANWDGAPQGKARRFRTEVGKYDATRSHCLQILPLYVAGLNCM